jgi:hypothetical protein
MSNEKIVFLNTTRKNDDVRSQSSLSSKSRSRSGQKISRNRMHLYSTSSKENLFPISHMQSIQGKNLNDDLKMTENDQFLKTSNKHNQSNKKEQYKYTK